MADNIDVTSGSGKTVAADDVGGVLYQRVKIAAGADGAATDVSDAAPLPIDDAGGSLTVDGTVAVTHAALTELGAAIDTEVQVDIVAPLPAGTNTIGKAIAIDGSGKDLEFAKEGDLWNAGDHGVILFARDTATNPDTYRAVQVDAEGHFLTTIADPLPAGTNNIGDVDVASSALPTGASTAANQTTLIGHVDGVETLLGTIDADTSTLAGAVDAGQMQVDIVGALPAGTNAIGKLAANSGVDIGDVDVASVAIPASIYHGQTAVTTAGTEVALASSQAILSGVTIKAKVANTGIIYVGANPVTSSTGFALAAGEQVFLEVANLATVYIDASVNGEGVSYLAS